MITLELPFPPSVNAMWRTVRGRPILSKKGRLWWDEAEVWYLDQKRKHVSWNIIPRIAGHFEAEMVLDKTKRRNSDIDNRIKAVLDAAEVFCLIENDRLCDRVTASWGEANGCLLTIKAIGGTND